MHQEMRDYIAACHECQLFAAPPLKRTPVGRVQVNRLFEQFSIDFVGPLPLSTNHNQYVIVAIERFTRWPLARATRNNDAATADTFIYEEIFCQFGRPAHMLTDNGSHFANALLTDFLRLVRTHHRFTTPYHPETNDMVERLNGTLTKSIKKLALNDPVNWDRHIPAVLYPYRTRAHETVRVSPDELLFGQAALPPDQDILQQLGHTLGVRMLSQAHRKKHN